MNKLQTSPFLLHSYSLREFYETALTAVVDGIASLHYVQPQVRVLRIPASALRKLPVSGPLPCPPRFSNPRICDSTFLYMEDDVSFSAFVNYSLAELDDPERFWKCWRLNDCGTCLNRGDGCGWCPYVRASLLSITNLMILQIFVSSVLDGNMLLYSLIPASPRQTLFLTEYDPSLILLLSGISTF